MSQAVINSMTAAEQRLLGETSSESLAGLDEDEVLTLHGRIRRARSKYVTKYRRSASGAVVKRGGRGFSFPKNQRDRDKAAIFEDALARVSDEVSAHASRAAAELRSARLASARTSGKGPARKGSPAMSVTPSPDPAPRPATKTTGGIKKDASTRAAGARRQAARDAR